MKPPFFCPFSRLWRKRGGEEKGVKGRPALAWPPQSTFSLLLFLCNAEKEKRGGGRPPAGEEDPNAGFFLWACTG